MIEFALQIGAALRRDAERYRRLAARATQQADPGLQKEQAGAGRAMEKQTNFGGNLTVKNTTNRNEPTEQNAKPMEIQSVANLSLRQWYAAMASDSDLRAQERKLRAKSPVGALPDNWTVLARFMHADAMLAEGNK